MAAASTSGGATPMCRSMRQSPFEAPASVAWGRMPCMVELPSPVPEQIVGLPRDGRGYPVPAENDWPDGEPSLAIQDWQRFGVLFANGRCSICGCKMRPNDLRYRPTGDEDRRKSQLAGNNRRSDGLTHYECSLFLAMICPFFATPQARHSESGAERGRFAAILGFKRVDMIRGQDANGDVHVVEFWYSDLEDPIVFKHPGELADRLAVAVANAEPIDVDDRLYWRSAAELAPAWEETQNILVPSRQSP
jgi:hypothetical protein